ncbi:hypothetical protein [Solibacillus sp. FSL K6-1523]|uniref:hypothetical protein n=1 Tax=Solibacillus sp. FSL K6-1523 TaxID=2921471 RepID=UPI0030F71113
MGKFDKDEQQIHKMFSEMKVDASKLTEQVKSRLHEESTIRPVKQHRRWTRPTVAAIVMSLMLVVSVTAAAVGNFDWFIERFNPSFSQVIEPVEAQIDDKGIRMEVIGAQKYDNQAIIYLSLQDITGQNRLTEQTNFQDGFSVKMHENEEGFSSLSTSQKMLYFNEDTNTVYYEYNITADPNSPLADPLEVDSSRIYFDENRYTDTPISIALAEVEGAETQPIKESQIWGGKTFKGDEIPSLKDILVPGNYADMPHGEKDQWVSAIGVINGKLHVQIGKVFPKEFGPSDAHLTLKGPDGNLENADYSNVFLADEGNNILDAENYGSDDVQYKYEEFVFSIKSEDLSKYAICYSGFVHAGVEGNWKVAANLSNPNSDMHTWKSNILVEDHLFEYLTLSPLGVQVIGTFKGEDSMASQMLLEVETVDGIILLEGGSGGYSSEKFTFDASWNTEEPLDVTKATVIIVNGIRIPIK